MSLNIGEAVEAARTLHQSDMSEVFQKVRDGILEQVRVRMNQALDCDPENLAIAVGYARALRDVWHALDTAAHGGRMTGADKPGLVGARHAPR